MRDTLDSPLLTVRDLMRVLNLSKMSVYRLLNTGELPSLLVGGLRRVRPEALQEYLAHKEKTSSLPSGK